MFCLTSTPSVGLPFINALGRRECPHKSERSVPWVGVLKCNLHNGDALGLRCYKIPLVLRLCHYKNAPPTQHRPDRVLKALDKFPPCPSFFKGIFLLIQTRIPYRAQVSYLSSSFCKWALYLVFQAPLPSRATHQTQIFKRSATKVSEEDCQSGLNKNAAIMEISNALSIKTGVLSSLLNLMRISMISLFSVFCFALPPIQNYSISLKGSSYRAWSSLHQNTVWKSSGLLFSNCSFS